MKQLLLSLIIICLGITANAQTKTPSTQPDYDAILKRVAELTEQQERTAEAREKKLAADSLIEQIVRDSGLTAPRALGYRPTYYPSYRSYSWLYFSRYYPRVYPRSYVLPIRSSRAYTLSPF